MSEAVPSHPLAPLAELLAEIATAPPLPPTLERALDVACRLAHADTGAIGRYDPVANVMRTVALRHAVHAAFPPVFAAGEGVGGYIIAHGKTYHGRYGDLPHPVVPELADFDVVGVPIRWQERLLGYLVLTLAPPRRFRPAQVEVVEMIASVCASAIEHAHRFEEERRTRERFELIARIAADLHRELGRDAILQRAADAIHETLGFPNVDIPLLDPTDPETLVVRVRGGDYKRRIQHEDRLAIDQGIMGAAVREHHTQLVNDVRRDPRYVCPPGVPPALAELAVPIRSGERVLGVLNVESDQPFDDLDRRSLEVIADYLAVAIDNAALYEQAGHAAVLAERQRLARELHDNVTQILSSMSLLSQTLVAAWQRSPEDGARRAARLQQLAQTAFAEMRMLLQQLAPTGAGENIQVSRRSRALVGVETLREHALPSALNKLLAAIVPESIAVKSSFAGYVPQRLEHEEALYRVCQEAISNTIRHAGAKRIRVEAAVTDSEAVLRVADDGRGLDTAFRPGVGLGSMRTRIENLQGQFRIASNNPRGTLVEARLPRADR
jgi:signal transduction histidine kinase